MATVVSTMFLASCADDVYDPSKESQVTPTENPLGEGFNAPKCIITILIIQQIRK